jgi:pimeloyl-ACP methyl ester carboxylesterase
MRAGTIEVGGRTLETGWWGPGPAVTPTLVFLHEGLGSVGLWRDVPERLSAMTGWGAFAYSRFGYGNSDTTPLPRPMGYMHDEAQMVLPAVLRAAEIGRAVLIGHSDGGSIAAIYAADSAVGLLGLVTIAAHFFVEELNLASIRAIKVAYESSDLRARLGRHHRDVEVAFRGWNDAWLDPRFRAFDITELLPRIAVPVLALQGADDPYGTAEQLRVFAAGVRGPITTMLIAGGRHAPHLEAREATLAATAEFIAGLQREMCA